ncbi:YqjF family protein [Siminovitchia sediminis]|uniref:YqjF family protein n=1 Tax=Siminovitchia sediminis TaxID=1274353 RepID=A0ABW4KP06_9BACI
MHKEFSETSQRPFSLPSRPWVMTQEWHHLLFCHWRIPPEMLREYVPKELEIDLFDGTSWIGLTPFKASKTRIRGLPAPPALHSFLELNVRVYVTYKGAPGIYFLSLDANSWPVVLGAKTAALLPYQHASMKLSKEEETVHFQSKRTHPGEPDERFSVSYKPESDTFIPIRGTLEFFLYERYCFFIKKGKRLFRGDIHHDRWRVCNAECMIHQNTMVSFLPRRYFQEKPMVHLSKEKQAFAWTIKKLR